MPPSRRSARRQTARNQRFQERRAAACSAGRIRGNRAGFESVQISPGVIAPGSSGTAPAAAAASTSGLRPGLTMNRAPAAAASSNCAADRMASGADHRLLDLLRGAADRLQGRGRAQGDLDQGQAAAGQRSGKRNGVGGVLDLSTGMTGRPAIRRTSSAVLDDVMAVSLICRPAVHASIAAGSGGSLPSLTGGGATCKPAAENFPACRRPPGFSFRRRSAREPAGVGRELAQRRR